VKATDRRTCPVCNTLFDNSSEFCPVCALNSALESESHATSSELRFEHYQILKNADGTPIELGHGAMGVTYKAVDVHLQCAVALKIINAQLIGDTSARHRWPSKPIILNPLLQWSKSSRSRVAFTCRPTSRPKPRSSQVSSKRNLSEEPLRGNISKLQIRCLTT
jgi:hypothetical protein